VADIPLHLDRPRLEFSSVDLQHFIHDLAHISMHRRGGITVESERSPGHVSHSRQLMVEQFKLLPRLIVKRSVLSNEIDEFVTAARGLFIS